MNSADIVTALNGLLVEKWPTRPVYLEKVPKQLARPSFLISLVRETRREANIGLFSMTDYLTISILEQQDAHGFGDGQSMITDQAALLELFESGKLTVGDRKLNVSASGGGTDDYAAYVDLQIDYLRERTVSASSGETPPNIENVNINNDLEG